ncbi:MAG: hypothetical protein ACRDNW_16285 [Trebonia sp.]
MPSWEHYSPVSADFPGTLRPLDPRWARRLVATTATPRDPLTETLIGYLRRSGLQVPNDITRQLSGVKDGRHLSHSAQTGSLTGQSRLLAVAPRRRPPADLDELQAERQLVDRQ